MDDLISRKTAIKAVEEYVRLRGIPPPEYASNVIKRLPSVPAVPLDKLCEFLSDNCFMHCHVCSATTGFCKEFEEASICGTPERWKAILTKWMEGLNIAE